MKLVKLIKMRINKTCSKVHMGAFPILNGLKPGKALLPLIFIFALEYDIRKVQEMKVGLKFNGTHQLLVYVDDINLLGDNKYHRENTETLIDTSKEVSLELNTEKTKYMLMYRHQNAGQTHNKW
jgi:hypothetical protein